MPLGNFSNLLNDINKILPFVIQAGEEIKKIYESDFDVYHKTKNDPLTEADIKANEIIVAALKIHFPQDAILSEEIPDDKSRLQFDRLWILDPLDGTREFVEKTDEFAITLGLSISGNAIAGIILNPVKAEIFVGIVGVGVYFSRNQCIPNNLSERDYFNNQLQFNQVKPHFLVSTSEHCKGLYNKDFWQKDLLLETKGSIAYKLALLADKKCDMVVSLQYKNEWDICGGVAIVKASGGIVTDLKILQEIRFNNEDTLIHGILAGHPEAVVNFYNKNKEYLRIN